MRGGRGVWKNIAAGLLTAVILVLLMPVVTEAADFSMLDRLEFSEIQNSVDEILGADFQFKNMVAELIRGGQPFTPETFLETVLGQFKENWRMEKKLLFSLLMLGIAAALLTNFSNIFRDQQIAEVSFEITYMMLFLLLLQVFTGAVQITASVLMGIREFMKALVPAYFLTVTMASGGVTALVFYQFLLGLIYLLEWLMERGMLPFIQVQVILVFINHLTKEEYLSQLSELVKKLADWVLKSILALVVGFNAIQGLLTPAIDALKTTAFSRTAQMIPGIGNIAGSVTDVILGSAMLIKNGVGVTALVVLVLLCLTPLVKLGVLMLLLKVSAALLQPVCDKRMVGCVDGVGDALRLLFRVVFTTAVLFMLTIVVVTATAGGIR